MPKLCSQCTPGEYTRYVQSYLATWDCLTDAIRYLAVKSEDQTLKPPEKLEIARELRRLRAERDALESKRQGFRANRKTISPPNSLKVKKAEQLAKDADKAIREAETVDNMVAIAYKALELFNSIQAA